MTHIMYREWNPKPESAKLVAAVNEIIEIYEAQDLTLTLRQLYYQLVVRNTVPNTERSYKNLGTLVTRGRDAGMISWDAIEDRAREHHGVYVKEHLREVVYNLEYHLALDMWARQDTYCEVWIEKEALGNVIEKPCRRLDVSYMSCKGYLSASEAWRAGQRFEQAAENGKDLVLFHLGDHDPSGIDMTRDNQERLELYSGQFVTVKRLALNMDQIEKYAPPPNPAKLTDSRAENYVAEHGTSSWELDALEPSIISDLIESNVKNLIDWDVWHETLEEQAGKRSVLEGVYDRWDEVQELLTE